MPPKKKSGKKKSGKKSERKSPRPQSQRPSTVDKLSEQGKDYYLIQIKDLERQLSSYQRKCDEIELLNQEFNKHFSQISSDKKDICEYLKISLQQRGDEITELNFELTQQQEIREADKKQYETQIQHLTDEYEETKIQLTSENNILSGKLSSMEEFKVQKEELMEKFADLEQKIAQTAQTQKDSAYRTEKEAVVDKDRLKKEMVSRVNQVASEFRKVSNKQMAETTQRTIRENVDLSGRLQRISEKTIQLIGDNDLLRNRDRDLRQQIELLEIIEKELAMKSHANNKAIRHLIDQCRDSEATLEDYESPEQVEETNRIQSEHDRLKQQATGIRTDYDRLTNEKSQLIQQLELDQTAIKEERRSLRRLDKLLHETRMALEDSQRIWDEEEEYTETEMIEKRQRMLESLLVLLNSAAALGLGPSPSQLGVPPVRGPTTIRSSGTSAASRLSAAVARLKEQQLNAAELVQNRIIEVRASASSGITAEKLAQFGLAARPPSASVVSATGTSSAAGNHCTTAAQLMRSLSPTTRLRRLVPARSLGTQTTGGTTLYADQLLARMPQGTQLLIGQKEVRNIVAQTLPRHSKHRFTVQATLF